MNERQLHRRAHQAYKGASKSQCDIAKALDVNRSWVSRALRNASLKHAAVQARIIS